MPPHHGVCTLLDNPPLVGDSFSGGFSGGGNSGSSASVYPFSYRSLQQSTPNEKVSTVFRRY